MSSLIAWNYLLSEFKIDFDIFWIYAGYMLTKIISQILDFHEIRFQIRFLIESILSKSWANYSPPYNYTVAQWDQTFIHKVGQKLKKRENGIWESQGLLRIVSAREIRKNWMNIKNCRFRLQKKVCTKRSQGLMRVQIHSATI